MVLLDLASSYNVDSARGLLVICKATWASGGLVLPSGCHRAHGPLTAAGPPVDMNGSVTLRAVPGGEAADPVAFVLHPCSHAEHATWWAAGPSVKGGSAATDTHGTPDA